MGNYRKAIPAALTGLAMTVLILDGRTALEGAADGIELCVRAVIPSLFPFLFLSVMLTAGITGLSSPILAPLERLCRIPKGAGGLLAAGLLGGYPVGAQGVAQAWRSGALSREDARRMLGFCSNAGPSFLFGMLCGVFDVPTLWALWGIHILSALVTGILLPGGSDATAPPQSPASVPPSQALERSLKIMARICGWVILFRVLLAFCRRWFLWAFPDETAVIFSGLLELTNGCGLLAMLPSGGARFLAASELLAWGGLCVGLQTVSVTGSLGTGLYFPGKLLQTGISLSMAWLAQPLLYSDDDTLRSPLLLLPGLAAVFTLAVLKNLKKPGSILARQGV